MFLNSLLHLQHSSVSFSRGSYWLGFKWDI